MSNPSITIEQVENKLQEVMDIEKNLVKMLMNPKTTRKQVLEIRELLFQNQKYIETAQLILEKM